jgi:hypothetical protein
MTCTKVSDVAEQRGAGIALFGVFVSVMGGGRGGRAGGELHTVATETANDDGFDNVLKV